MGLARRLAAVLSRLGPPDLVVCGDRSALGGTGALPALLAHYLGASQALGRCRWRFEGGGSGPGDGHAVIGERRLDAGWRERLRLQHPCGVFGRGGRRPASAGFPGGGAGRGRASRFPWPWGRRGGWRVAPRGRPPGCGRPLACRPPRPYRPRTKVVAPPEGSTRERLLALTGALVTHDPPRLVGPIDADGAVDELVDFLGRHGYLDQDHGAGAAP